jgi:hypothetical protein
MSNFLTDLVKYKDFVSSYLGITANPTIQGDRPGFTIKLGASATMANPGNGWFRLANIGSVDTGDTTQLAINVNSFSPVIDMSALLAAAGVGTVIRFSPKLNSGTDYCVLRVVTKTSMEGGTWYLFDVVVMFVTPGLPNSTTGLLPIYVVDYQYDEGIREDVNGNLVNGAGTVISGIDKGTYADMAALTPSAENGNYFHVTDYGVNGIPMRYQASTVQGEWIPDGRQNVSDKVHDLYLVFPETNASAVANNGSGKCRVTMTGHLLTAPVCLPVLATAGYDKVKLAVTAGTNWTAGQYTILAVPDANTVDIDYPYTAGLGVPTIPIKGNSVIIDAFTVLLPPLGKRTEVRVRVSAFFTAATISRQIKMYLNTIRFGQAIFNSTGNVLGVVNQGFYNRGATNAQRSIFHLNMMDDSNQTANIPVDMTVQTNVQTTLTFDLQSTNSNLVVGVDRLQVWIQGV